MRPMVLLAALALVAGACAKKTPQTPTPAPLPVRPLAGFAERPMIVLPIRYLRPVDSLGWAPDVSRPRDLLRDIDHELELAMEDRGVKGIWEFPETLARSARRNVGFMPDPYTLAAEVIRPPTRRLPEELPDPLASQLRQLVALSDARYVLYPVELRFEKAGGGTGRPVLHLVVIDARAARPIREADVRGDSATSFSPALATSVAGHTADLIAAP